MLQKNRLAVIFVIAYDLLFKEGFTLEFDDGDEVEFFINDLFDLFFEFDQI